MKISKILIEGYRLLDNIEICLEDITTAIVGKNNSGKTSFSEIFQIFMNKSEFAFEDFSINSHQKFEIAYATFLSIDETNKEEKSLEIIQNIPKIKLLLNITYNEADNWTNIKPFITSLSDDNKISILFEYLPKDSERFLQSIKEAIDSNGTAVMTEVKSHFRNHYQITIKPYSEVENTAFIELSAVKKLLRCHFIEAQRDLEDSKSNNTKLSSIFQQQYDYKTRNDESGTDELIKATKSANDELERELTVFFQEFVDSFQEFGFPGLDREKLELESNLEVANLFKNNVRLVYNHGDNKLPEKYNGLGYKNLMYIISKILNFKVLHEENGCDLNLLFIEEPEAHMHPQMQSVFIKNITKFLESKNFNVQVIISTHSSHILTNATFESIRYFTKDNYITSVKDLRYFHTTLSEPDTLDFLEQYLTLDKSELFFADKAVLFEGVVERLLMPIFIRKVEEQDNTIKLSEQYISHIEVGGAYMNKFKELLKFLDISTLIITDIDAVEKIEKPDIKGTLRASYSSCKVTEHRSLLTSNVCLKKWLPCKSSIDDLLNANEAEKIDEKIRVAYQTKVSQVNKCGRSFEEAFIIENPTYIFENRESLSSIKYELRYYDSEADILEYSYELHDFIDRNKKKTDFAFDLLNHQNSWNVPSYIKEGLIWLAQH